MGCLVLHSLSPMSMLTTESMKSNPGAQYYEILSYTEKAIFSKPTLSMIEVKSLSSAVLITYHISPLDEYSHKK